ncbi:MAG: hypothetical protein P4L83_00280 [Nevskia sp.]|nr:hypothetical protein [Nevskia sp.]
MRLTAAAAALLVPLLSACVAIYTPPLEISAAPDSRHGYLYGRFKLERVDRHDDSIRAGLAVDPGADADTPTDGSAGENYTIEFAPDALPKAIAVKPGTYHIGELIGTVGNHELLARKELSGPFTAPFDVHAGEACYVGDMIIEVRGNYGRRDDTIWKLSSLKDNYDPSTAQLRQTLPGFAQLRTRNILAEP